LGLDCGAGVSTASIKMDVPTQLDEWWREQLACLRVSERQGLP
jgi:hypothetical protein